MPTSWSSIGGAIHPKALADRKGWLWRLVGAPVGKGKSSSVQPQDNFRSRNMGVMVVADFQVGDGFFDLDSSYKS
jgi:hypothetical protein